MSSVSCSHEAVGLKPPQSLGHETVLWMSKGWLLWHHAPVEWAPGPPLEQYQITRGYRLECGFRERYISSSAQGFAPSLTPKKAIYWDTCASCLLQIARDQGEGGWAPSSTHGHHLCLYCGPGRAPAFCTPLGLGEPTMRDRNSQPWEKMTQRESDQCL